MAQTFVQKLDEQDKVHDSIIDLLTSMMSMIPFADAVKENEFKLKVKYTWRTVQGMLEVIKDASELALKYMAASPMGE